MSSGKFDLHKYRWNWLEGAAANGDYIAPQELGAYYEATGYARPPAAVGALIAAILKAKPKTGAAILRKRKGGTHRDVWIKRQTLRCYDFHHSVAAGETGPLRRGCFSGNVGVRVPKDLRGKVQAWLSHDEDASQNDVAFLVAMLTKMAELKDDLAHEAQPWLIAQHYTVHDINQRFGKGTITMKKLKEWLPGREEKSRTRKRK